MKASKEFHGHGSVSNALAWAAKCLARIIAGGKSGRIIVECYDGPNDDMRGKLHAMAHDLAEQVRYFRGCDMGEKVSHREASWKAVLVSAAVADRFVPGYNGGLISVRPSSENLSKRAYCDAIEAAYAIGAEMNVVWSDPKHRQERQQERAAA